MVLRHYDALLLLLHDVIHERVSKDVKEEAVQCIAVVAQVLGNDARKSVQASCSTLHCIF